MALKRIKKEKIIVTSGIFDPISVEDVDFLKRCRAKGEWLIVGLHTDYWAVANRGGFMQPYGEREIKKPAGWRVLILVAPTGFEPVFDG